MKNHFISLMIFIIIILIINAITVNSFPVSLKKKNDYLKSFFIKIFLLTNPFFS